MIYRQLSPVTEASTGLKESFPCTFKFTAFTSPQPLLTNGFFTPEGKDSILFLLWPQSDPRLRISPAWLLLPKGSRTGPVQKSDLGGPVQNTDVDMNSILYSLGTAHLRTGVRSGLSGEIARIWQTPILHSYRIITSVKHPMVWPEYKFPDKWLCVKMILF